MKKPDFYVFILLIGFFTSCQSSTAGNDEANTDIDSTEIDEGSLENEAFLSLEKWNSLAGEKEEYYIISYAGFEDKEKAIAEVSSLKKNYPNAGYLWIPDFASLSGKQIYAVFLDQGSDQAKIIESLESKKVDFDEIYVVRVNQYRERWAAYSANDIRIDGKKVSAETQKMIFIYEAPQDQDDYSEGGGEDWAYFTEDVSEYFKKKYPSVEVDNFYNGSLSPERIKYLEKELELKSKGMGYIVINGGEAFFIEHNMPDEVITEACELLEFKKYRP